MILLYKADPPVAVHDLEGVAVVILGNFIQDFPLFTDFKTSPFFPVTSAVDAPPTETPNKRLLLVVLTLLITEQSILYIRSMQVAIKDLSPTMTKLIGSNTATP